MERKDEDAGHPSRLASLRLDADQLFLQTTAQTRMAQCISDPHQPDCPIVYCNEAFVELTGYPIEEIIGRNCRFLQGEKTLPSAVKRLREAVDRQVYTVVDILNYRKDGTPFWNAVHIGPIYNSEGELEYFFGSQWDITELLAARETIVENDRVTDELRHRTDNLFAVLTAIVRLSARGAEEVEELSEKIQRRVEALAAAHRVSLSADGIDTDTSDLRTLVEAVMKPYRSSNADRIDIVGETIELPRKHVTPLGLSLHELATNALKYGALSRGDGRVHVDWEVEDEMVVIHWIERLGEAVGLADGGRDAISKGTGTRLMRGVIGGIGGSVESHLEPEGLRATIRVPRKAN
ncbi:MAG: PAS domain-containing protein [Erythrobacter sp.]|nr:PAS domain-containing protein [Erythrobacter sp.]